MNAAKQEMFETVRSVVAGRLRDEAQIRELAHRISEESTTLRRRLDRAVGYARAGLRLEACAEAEAEPSVFELAAAFDSDVMRQWRILCSKNKLPLQDEIASDAIAEIEEAIALTAPLRSRLARGWYFLMHLHGNGWKYCANWLHAIVTIRPGWKIAPLLSQ